MTGMYHNSVVGNVVDAGRHASISSPVIRVYHCPRSDASGDDGIKGGNVTSSDNLEVTSCRSELCRHYSKKPTILWPLFFPCYTENVTPNNYDIIRE